MEVGTILNLCKLVGNTKTIEDINKEIIKGNLANVDLTIQDVAINEIQNLPKDTTSANFGKLNDKATKADIILGITNMVFETIGMMAVFGTQNTSCKNIIVIGNIATMPYLKTVLNKIEKLHGVIFEIPDFAEFGTAFGAVKATMN